MILHTKPSSDSNHSIFQAFSTPAVSEGLGPEPSIQDVGKAGMSKVPKGVSSFVLYYFTNSS